MMKSQNNEKRAVEAAIGWIQKVIAQTLDLDAKPEDLAPVSNFRELALTPTGKTVPVDSMKVVDVILVLEEALGVDVAEMGEFQREFEEKDFTIENMARFLVRQFRLEPRRIRKLARSTKR
jgi:acyl carrier protein